MIRNILYVVLFLIVFFLGFSFYQKYHSPPTFKTGDCIMLSSYKGLSSEVIHYKKILEVGDEMYRFCSGYDRTEEAYWYDCKNLEFKTRVEYSYIKVDCPSWDDDTVRFTNYFNF